MSTPLLGLALPLDGTTNWGTLVNASVTALLDSAIAGTTTLSADADVTLSTTVEAANQARQAMLLCTGARAAVRTIVAPAQSKTYVVINNTTGGYGVKLCGTGPTTGVTIPNGKAYVVAWNGTDFIVTGEVSAATASADGLIKLGSDTQQTIAANAVSATASRSYALQLNASGQGVINVPWTDTTYSTATTSANGLIKLGSDTQQTVAANSVSATASRSYALQLNASGQGVINVPWTDTTYSTATTSANGLIKLGSDTQQTVTANSVTATASRTYALQLNASGQGVVNVPWTDTTYSTATTSANGLIKLGSDTQQTVTANAVSATASRTYSLQLNASGQGVINVPWTDTTYSTATTSANGLIKLGSDAQQTTAANSVSTTASRTYALQLNAAGQGVINVPWTDTTYSTATTSANGLIKLGSDTQQTTAANPVTTTTSRTYAIQLNASGQAVVNVPWTDTSSGGSVTSVGLSLPTQFSVTNSPVTTSGTLTAAWTNQSINTVLAGPATGSAGAPTFRALVAADVPTLNQNTTGSAASLSISGQSGLLTFTGLAATNRTKTVRDAADTILELGGSYTPSGTWNWTSASVTWPTFNQSTTGNAGSATKLATTNFTVEESGGKLIFKYGSTVIASMTSTGVFTALSDVAGGGTP